MQIILPESMGAPAIPESFLEGLRGIDAGLCIYWNRFQHRFVIDRCINPAPHTHSITCARANVLICEDEEHGYMGPCDRILDRIRSMDAWTKYGDSGELGLMRQRKERENAKAEWDAKAKEEAKAVWRDGFRDDRVQVNKLVHLLQQHDILRPNK